ncbi:helix-turn-helix domain-containing protein [Hymenobacter glacieicola]|uniref:Helix-turn-helix domain-containing protein n=1 Tax=Hymenobacter glacieicola TaxID=1562124 RepID=A0ABQ1WKA8_9BACT|nr:helix-turn-helix domain-containing protein [Hymenobacter glacieicola]GGG33874.1 hypothetical protein GCM10011378_07920 [Hymenobacter glacieicola]
MMTALALSASSPGFDLIPATEQHASMLDRIAKEEVLGRLFYLSDKMTPGLDYDDRLQKRLKLSKNTIKKYVSIGRLKAAVVDGKIIVSEEAIRQFANPAYCVNSLPHLTGRVNLSQLTEVETKHLPPHAVQLAPEAELHRRAHEIVQEEPELADETRFVVQKELHRRTSKKKINA